MPHTLVQLSDLHLLADPDGTLLGCPVRASLQSVVEAAREDAPDTVLVTGDLSQDGSSASYQAAADLLAPLGAPCHAIPGNHDDAGVLADALASAPPFQAASAFDAGSWRIVMLDSAVPGEVHGRLAASTLAGLSDALSAHPAVPTVLALHHPPKPPGASWLAPLCLHGPEAFLDLVARHEQVRVVLSGHIHQAMQARHAQAHLLSCPATAFQFEPDTDEFALDHVPAGYRHLTLHPDGRFDTRVERIGQSHTFDADSTGY